MIYTRTVRVDFACVARSRTIHLVLTFEHCVFACARCVIILLCLFASNTFMDTYRYGTIEETDFDEGAQAAREKARSPTLNRHKLGKWPLRRCAREPEGPLKQQSNQHSLRAARLQQIISEHHHHQNCRTKRSKVVRIVEPLLGTQSTL